MHLLHPRNQEIFTLIAEIYIQNQQEPSIRDLPSIAHERAELVTHIGRKFQKCNLTKVRNDDPKMKVRFSLFI
jgi:hypothetical protein